MRRNAQILSIIILFKVKSATFRLITATIVEITRSKFLGDKTTFNGLLSSDETDQT